MGFAHGWFRMILRCYWELFPCFCFGILEKNRKSEKTGKSGHYRAPKPLRREPMSQRRPSQGVGYPRHNEAEVQK